MAEIRVKRVYEPVGKEDGRRFLVERLWPRGIKKTDLAMDGWVKEVAPSGELRQWFRHEADKWEEFQRRYFKELDSKPEEWEPLWQTAKNGNVTLLFSARESEHNNAVALKIYLERKRTAPMSRSGRKQAAE
jgi:uncharacterized protein YeaO (DUF488 family)